MRDVCQQGEMSVALWLLQDRWLGGASPWDLLDLSDPRPCHPQPRTAFDFISHDSCGYKRTAPIICLQIFPGTNCSPKRVKFCNCLYH